MSIFVFCCLLNLSSHVWTDISDILQLLKQGYKWFLLDHFPFTFHSVSWYYYYYFFFGFLAAFQILVDQMLFLYLSNLCKVSEILEWTECLILTTLLVYKPHYQAGSMLFCNLCLITPWNQFYHPQMLWKWLNISMYWTCLWWKPFSSQNSLAICCLLQCTFPTMLSV